MKIAILSCFYPYRGGISQFNSHLLGELGKNNVVKAFNFKRQYPEFLFPGKTQYVTEQDDFAPVESQRLLDTINPISWEVTARRIREWNPDLLILRYWMPWFAPSLGYVARRMKPLCKVIAILDNVIPHEKRPGDKLLTRFFLRSIHGAVTMCKEVESDLRKWAPTLPGIVREHPVYDSFGKIIPRSEALKAIGLADEPGTRTLLFFGLIREYKGLDILINAFNLLGPGYRLVIAGEPYGSFEKYSRLIEESPARERIHLYDRFIPNSEVKNFFCASDVTVLPYRSATQSGVSSASYNFDVPMIVTNVGGLYELIGKAGTGLVSQEVSAPSVAQTIKEFFEDPSVKAGCVENIHRVKEELSWENYCKALLDFAGKLK